MNEEENLNVLPPGNGDELGAFENYLREQVKQFGPEEASAEVTMLEELGKLRAGRAEGRALEPPTEKAMDKLEKDLEEIIKRGSTRELPLAPSEAKKLLEELRNTRGKES